MAELASDELWRVFEPLISQRRKSPRGGRPRLDNRAAFTGILIVLKSGIPWEMLPREMGCGSGSTCWRRLCEWQQRGAWKRLHRSLLERLAAADAIDWARASLDSRSLRAKKGGPTLARTRRTRANRARSSLL